MVGDLLIQFGNLLFVYLDPFIQFDVLFDQALDVVVIFLHL